MARNSAFPGPGFPSTPLKVPGNVGDHDAAVGAQDQHYLQPVGVAVAAQVIRISNASVTSARA